jgi:hypothetical protein
MKLSDLILYRSAVDHLTWESVIALAHNTAVFAAADLSKAPPEAVAAHTVAANTALAALNAAEAALNNAKHALYTEIESRSKEYFSRSETWYQRTKSYDSPEYVKSRAISWIPSAFNTVKARVLNLISWQYPVMVIRPYCSPFLEHIVAGDPVYFVDQNPELLTMAAKSFSTDYQRRLGLYSFDENQSKFLTQLPDGQFGFILVTNYFEFVSFEVLKQLLGEIWTKLRPGGSVGFTFNDCTRHIAVMHTESEYAAFTPGHLLKAYATLLGFEVMFEHEASDSSTWLELKKPGVLESLRGGQSLAKIIDQPRLSA